ncbi:MAG: beta/gamma crystallin-related protein [Waterburya sp.]
MSLLNNQAGKLIAVPCVEDLSYENAVTIVGGTGYCPPEGMKPDVVLYTDECRMGTSLGVNEAVNDLNKYNFDNKVSSITVNNDKTWRFYADKDFSGAYIDVKPGESLDKLTALNDDIESLKSL